MPRKTKTTASSGAAMSRIPNELLDQFVTGPTTAESGNVVSMGFKRVLIERALGAGLSHHPGHGFGTAKPEEATNRRNGSSAKTVLTDAAALCNDLPRDGNGTFEPLPIPKHGRRFTGFDDKAVARYARGMAEREIQGFVQASDGMQVSLEFISSVTDAVMAEVGAWQVRPPEPKYPVVFFDALRSKIREHAVVRNMAVSLRWTSCPTAARTSWALGPENPGGKVLAAGFQAPQDLIRNCLDFASGNDRRGLAQAIRLLNTASSAGAVEAALAAFERGPRGQKFTTVVASWRSAWNKVTLFFTFPPVMPKVVCSTNAIERGDTRLRKIIKTRGRGPGDDAANNQIWVALCEVAADWERAAQDWKVAMNQVASLYADRFAKTVAECASLTCPSPWTSLSAPHPQKS